MRKLVILLAVSLGAGSVPAQPIWRCGNTYGSVPCEGGSVLPAARAATPTEAAQARAVGKTDAELAAALEQARLKREKEAPGAVVPPAAAAASAKAPVRKPVAKKKEPQHLTVLAPAPKKK